MHAPGSRRARELAARESLARAVADVGACTDEAITTALIAAIGAAESTARPGEGPSGGFVAPALLARARRELAGAEARCEARAELHRAVQEGGGGGRGVSEGAVRRALALGVAADDPAVVSANAALLERAAADKADEQKRAEELRREIEGPAGGDGPVRKPGTGPYEPGTGPYEPGAITRTWTTSNWGVKPLKLALASCGTTWRFCEPWARGRTAW